jgi:hypothetical protein
MKKSVERSSRSWKQQHVLKGVADLERSSRYLDDYELDRIDIQL